MPTELQSLLSPPKEAILVALWILILAAGFFTIGRYLWDYRRLRTAFKRHMEDLRGASTPNDTPDGAQNRARMLTKLRASFKASPLLRNPWHEFDATLVPDSSPDGDIIGYLTTLDAGQFFNEATLVDEPLKLEFRRHIPGMLTAAGIIGTFGGLIIGLRDFSDANLQESISHLLHGVHNAFACSFWAIMLSVLVTFTERQVVTHLYARVHEFQEALSRLFNRSVTDNYLHAMVGQLGEQTQSLKSFSQDLSESIRITLQEVVHQQTKSIADANALVANQIANSMNTILEPAVDRLAASVESMQRQQAESNQQGLSDLIDKFGQALTQTTGRQMDALMATLAGSTETLTSLKSELGSFMEVMRTQAEAQQEQVRAQMNALSAFSSDQQRMLSDEMKGFVGQIAGTMAELQAAMLKQSGESVSQLGSEITRIVESFQLRQEEALVRLTERMTTMHDALDQKLDTALRKLDQNALEQTQRMAHAVESTVAQMQAETQAALQRTQTTTTDAIAQLVEKTTLIAAGSERLTDRLEQHVAGINTAAERLITQANAGTSEMATLQERFANRMVELVKTLDDSADRLGKLGQGQRALLEAMATGLKHYQDGAQDLARSAQTYSDTHQKNQLLFAGIERQVQLMDQRLEGIKQLNNGFQAAIDHHGRLLSGVQQDTERFFSAVREQVDSFRDTVVQSMTEYNQVAKGSLDNFLGSVDTELSKAVKSLGAAISDLDEQVDGLGSALGKGSRK